MGLFSRRQEEKAAVAAATAHAERWISRLQGEMSADQVSDGRVRRLFQASAVGAAVAVEGGILLPNSQLRFPDGADETTAHEDVIRRAQWAIALSTLRLIVPDDEDDLQAEIAAQVFDSVEDGTERAATARTFWVEDVSDGSGPGPDESMDLLGDQEWFRRLAMWVVGPLTVREPDRPVALGVTAATVHLQRGAGEAFRLYAG